MIHQNFIFMCCLWWKSVSVSMFCKTNIQNSARDMLPCKRHIILGGKWCNLYLTNARWKECNCTGAQWLSRKPPFPFFELSQFPFLVLFLPMQLQWCECIFIVSLVLKSGSQLTDFNQEVVLRLIKPEALFDNRALHRGQSSRTWRQNATGNIKKIDY